MDNCVYVLMFMASLITVGLRTKCVHWICSFSFHKDYCFMINCLYLYLFPCSPKWEIFDLCQEVITWPLVIKERLQTTNQPKSTARESELKRASTCTNLKKLKSLKCPGMFNRLTHYRDKY